MPLQKHRLLIRIVSRSKSVKMDDQISSDGKSYRRKAKRLQKKSEVK